MKKIELLMPAGDLARCKVAIDYGADAVYIGGQSFSLRSRASNFTLADITAAVEYAHQRQKKIYVTVNMIFHDEDLVGIKEYLLFLDQANIDAIIVASTYILLLAKELKVKYEVHMSTQLSLLNRKDIEFYQELKADRVVLGRELTLAEIKEVRHNTTMPLEVFIHGAMCTNYSGRCTLSNEMTNRDANRGGCAQSCRWKYYLYHEDQLVSDKDILFSMSSKDLAGLAYVKDMIEIGVDSLKIEGRMKSAYYLANIARTYRRYIDLYYQVGDKISDYLNDLQKDLAKAENRLACSGFFDGVPDYHDHLYGINGAGVTHEFVAYVLAYDEVKKAALIQVRNVINLGQELEVLTPTENKPNIIVNSLLDEDLVSVSCANQPMKELWLATDVPLAKGDMLRRID